MTLCNVCFLQYPNYPLAMYQVSGEYAMFWHASMAGAIDLRKVLMETLEGMRRSGIQHGTVYTAVKKNHRYRYFVRGGGWGR